MEPCMVDQSEAAAERRWGQLLCRKAKRGETVVLTDGTQWTVARAKVNGDVWLQVKGDYPFGPYDTTEYRVRAPRLASRRQRRIIIRLAMQKGITCLDRDDRLRAFAFVAHADTTCSREDARRIISTLRDA